MCFVAFTQVFLYVCLHTCKNTRQNETQHTTPLFYCVKHTILRLQVQVHAMSPTEKQEVLWGPLVNSWSDKAKSIPWSMVSHALRSSLLKVHMCLYLQHFLQKARSLCVSPPVSFRFLSVSLSVSLCPSVSLWAWICYPFHCLSLLHHLLSTWRKTDRKQRGTER